MVLLNCVTLGMYKPGEECNPNLEVSVSSALLYVGTGSEMFKFKMSLCIDE